MDISHLVINSAGDEHLDGFHLLSTINSAAMNLPAYGFF